MDYNELYRIVWEKVDPAIREGYDNGTYQMFNGVLRDVTHKYKVISKHLPLEKIDCGDLGNIDRPLSAAQQVQKLQAAVGGMVAISTVAIMGAIILATAYLANKINKLQEQVAQVQRELQDQNFLFYSEKLTSYFGMVEALQDAIRFHETIEENEDYIIHLLAMTAVSRNQLLSFVNTLVKVSDSFSFEHKRLAIDFINMSLDLIPKGAFIESQAAYKIKRFQLGDSIRLLSLRKYQESIETYRQWANATMKSLISGATGVETKALQAKAEEIRIVIRSPENTMILEHSV